MTASPISNSEDSGDSQDHESIDGTGRHLTKLELQAWTGFIDASRMLEERLASQLNSCFDMTHREYEVLVRLDGANGRLRMSELAQKMVASQPLMTQTVSRLEKRGWVRREASTVDRRSTETVLTDDGRKALREASGPHADLVKQLLLDLIGQKNLGVFAAGVSDVADHLRAHRRGEGCSIDQCPLG